MSAALATRTVSDLTLAGAQKLDGVEVIVYAGFKVNFGELEVQVVDDTALLILRSGDRGQPARIPLAEVDTVEIPVQRRGV